MAKETGDQTTAAVTDSQTTVKPMKGPFKELRLLFREIWAEMNRPLTDEEAKIYREYLRNNPYPFDGINGIGRTGFSPW